METAVTIAPRSAAAVRLPRGRRLRVIDVAGGQVADLVAFVDARRPEAFSQGFTRMNNEKVTVTVGDYLYSSGNARLLKVVEDTVGVHDMLFPPCNAFLYENNFGISAKTGCREHLASALAEFDIAEQSITDPFNVFMHTDVDKEGRMCILSPTSEAGDYFEVEAQEDLIIGVSACAADVTDCNNGQCTEIRLAVL